MTKTLDLESALSGAAEQEREYNWLGAAESYKKAQVLIPKHDILKMGEITERLGYAFYRVAMQAEGREEFGERMRQAVANYEKAKESYRSLGEAEKRPSRQRCDAMIAYISYWNTSEVSEKKRLLNECWTLTKEALKAYEKAGEALEFGKTYNQLSSSAYHGYAFEWDFEVGKKMIGEAKEFGEKAIALLSSVGDSKELAKAYMKTALYLGWFGWCFVPDLDERERHYSEAREYRQKANELSEETALLELLSIVEEGEVWTIDEMLMHYEKALGYAERTKDHFLIGTALDCLIYTNFAKEVETEDPDKKAEIVQKALQHAKDAKYHFSRISFTSSRAIAGWIEAPYVDSYWKLAEFETNITKRRDLLEKAVANGTYGVNLAERTGYHLAEFHTHSSLSRALGALGKIEVNNERKRRLLQDAMMHREKSIRIGEQLYRFQYWNLGAQWSRLADLKAELSNVEKDPDNSKNLLQEAVSNKEHGLELGVKENLMWERHGEVIGSAILGTWHFSFGELLNQLYELTNNSEHQRKAIKALGEASEFYKKVNLVSRVAECCWKCARGYDTLGEHLKAAESFKLASNNYTSAAEKIPQLKDFYEDHALYMQAWSEIEKARHHHTRQEYGLAREYYEKAATIHKSLRHWSYLAPNYSAWAQVESAEDMSRREKSEEAIQAFEQAARLFDEAKESLRTKLGKIENVDEKQMASNLLSATDLRREYCTGRTALEEAKILDKKGDHYGSSVKYGFAAETFQKITEELESEQDRKELQPILTISRAWQKMTQAETEISPTLYSEASQLFEQAKEISPNEKAKMLALGHSHFCRALEAGTKFADTRNPNFHAVAIQHLESAANYYLQTGFQNASEYARATELLFDAYLHMDNAKKERQPGKRAKLYAMAEKVLQTSAGFYMKAEHPEKREQVQRLLDKVKQEQELALSLSEVLHAPSIVSTTTAFTTPTPTHEEAVGLEKFEHAAIQANIITRKKELKVGENLDLEIELVNAGKGPALLIKVTDVIPEGFEPIEKPEKCRVEGGYLNMKGKRLAPLRTEEVRLVLKPKVQGIFPLKPRILYLDENGKYKFHEPEPITITVKELGIKGWLKGER